MSHGLDHVRQAAKQKDVKFTALLDHIDAELLRSAYVSVRRHCESYELVTGRRKKCLIRLALV